MGMLETHKTDYEQALRDFYLGLAMQALIPMVDSEDAGKKMPFAAMSIVNGIMEARKQ